MKNAISHRIKIENQCEKLLYALIVILVFEGIIRKLLPPLSMAVFFLKDILCILAFIKINNVLLAKDIIKIQSKWLTLFYLFLPLLIFTASKDILLAFFAAKQYLLYMVTVILVVVAFPAEKEEHFRKFLFFCSLLVIPTTIVAIIQDSLPATHWLNLSVGGDNLQGFSAAGHLRVGSTFSFTAQYSWFLIAEAFFVAASFFMQPTFKNSFIKSVLPFTYFLLIVILVVSTFITGGRTAVLGCGGTLALGTVFIGIRKPEWFMTRAVPMIFVAIISLIFLRTIKPEFFAAYDARSTGTAEVSHNEEIEGRLLSGFTSWTSWFWQQDIVAVALGNGLGIMSNGSSQISRYAANIRDDGFWTEGDVPTTFWEGGFYLGIIWYGFRLSIILLCYRMWRAIKNNKLAFAASVPLGHVVIEGVNGTLSMQPPLAIWWWLSVAVVFFIYRSEKQNLALLTSVAPQQYEEENYFH